MILYCYIKMPQLVVPELLYDTLEDGYTWMRLRERLELPQLAAGDCQLH